MARPWNRSRWLFAAASVAVLTGAVCLPLLPDGVPNLEAARHVLDNLERDPDSEVNIAAAGDLLVRLQKADSPADDEVLNYVCDRLEQMYGHTRHPSVFECVTNAMIATYCCSYQNTICATYERLLNYPEFFVMFRQSGLAHRALEFCIGASFDEHQVRALVEGRVGSMEELASMHVNQLALSKFSNVNPVFENGKVQQ